MKKRVAKKIVKQYDGSMFKLGVSGDNTGDYAISAYYNEMPKRFANDKAVKRLLKNKKQFTFNLPINMNHETALSGFLKNMGGL